MSIYALVLTLPFSWFDLERDGSSVEGKSSNSSDFMAGSSSSTDTNSEYEWYPQQKLEVARKKLDGVNPSGKRIRGETESKRKLVTNLPYG
jgi:hypothetical protein